MVVLVAELFRRCGLNFFVGEFRIFGVNPPPQNCLELTLHRCISTSTDCCLPVTDRYACSQPARLL